MEKDFKAVIFDMDGVLVDSEPAYWKAEEELAREYDKEVSVETLLKMMGRPAIESMKIFANDLGLKDSPDILYKKRDEKYIKIIETELKPMDGVIEVLKGLKSNGLKTAVATAACKELLNIQLSKIGILNNFDFLLSGNDIKDGKPHPEIYLKTVSLFGLKPDECVVVEDSPSGIEAGIKAGCFTVAFPNKYQDMSNLPKADMIITNIKEILSIL